MKRRPAPTVASRSDRPAPAVTPISEHAFHRALDAAPPARRSNDFAGETFTALTPQGSAVYVRVNDRHVRIDDAGSLTHTQALRLAAREDRLR